MLYSVDFSIKINGDFHTIHTAFIHAESVSRCNDLAKNIKADLLGNKNQNIHIFIEA